MSEFVLLTIKDSTDKQKCLVRMDDIKLVWVIENNGGGHFCSEISMRNKTKRIRVVETPEEIAAKIEQALKEVKP